MKARRFSSDDGRFVVLLPESVWRDVIAGCLRAGSKETGGILVGRYTSDRVAAIITAASGPPTDSNAGRWWFSRGVKGLQKWLDSLWRDPDPTYYLGEWHLHPGAAPDPSATDLRQMAEIAAEPKRACPEPILMIVGGVAPAWEVRVFVTRRGADAVALTETPSGE